MRTLFGDGFRVFFLAAGLFAVFSIALWEGWLAVHATGGLIISMPFAPAPHLWHAHEMIFGYAGAAMGGFFLTAVPNWTGAKAARHAFILAVSGLWLAGRLAVWWSGHIDPFIVAVIDLAFLPVLAAKIATQLVKRPKPQNLMFLVLLTMIWSGNLLVHLEWTGLIADGVEPGLHLGLLAVTAVIVVIGGRVTPAFTRNAMTRAGVEENLPQSFQPLDATAIASAILLPLLLVFVPSESAIGVLAIVTGLSQALRLAGWRTLWCLDKPILWSLHLGFAMLAAGYLALGLAYLGLISQVAALHLLGIGAVGGMTLAVMSRAILGHAGLPLTAPRSVALAYGLIAAAAIFRASGSIAGLDWYNIATLTSGALWIIAFAIFVSVFFPILITPRKL
ncbi:NnrS family protein [Hoeflea prorocentri]|uniref:NnrS family protein n=1 Tax=Hoeflea prorocentri TaxID=1922333 RepID=A0A9X3ZFX9_9HYPH|nr:NnrS family protein [Hoeflea prorocentri]MCY6380187.1 NnrS family protein [Hoeflea prorocentri]MDA5397987.1 NnrS family protein [Hoeflea prorocentri]